MKISDLIHRLEAIKSEHGDLEVAVQDREFGCADDAREVRVRAAVRNGTIKDDSECLGDTFVEIL